MDVTTLDLDVTENCPLRCDYCYKRAGASANGRTGESRQAGRRLKLETGQAAVDWLLRMSGKSPRVRVFFFGGEPLLEFDLIKELVRYGRERAERMGKRMDFGGPSNLVLLTEEIVKFWRENQMSLGSSIDGAPSSQDRHRCFPDGSGSSPVVEENIPKVLALTPNATARATLMPDNVARLYDDLLYFVQKGYRAVAFIPAAEVEWRQEHWEELDEQFERMTSFYVQRYREGRPIRVKYLDDAIQGIVNPVRRRTSCGAGRGLLAVDVEGTIWPCHRFSGYDDGSRTWDMGTVFGDFRPEKREPFLTFDARRDMRADCEHCLAVNTCGVCVALNWAAHRDIAKPHPVFCRMKQIVFPHAQRAHYLLRSAEAPLFMEAFYPRRKASVVAPPKVSPLNRVPRLGCTVVWGR